MPKCPYHITRTKRQNTNNKRRILLESTFTPEFVDIRRLDYTPQQTNFGTYGFTPHAAFVEPQGRYIYSHDIASNVYRQYEMTTPGDLSTLEDTGNTYPEVFSNTAWSIRVFADGQYFMLTTAQGTFIAEMQTPYDVSTLNVIENDILANYNVCWMSDDGSQMGIVHYLSSPSTLCYHYDLSTPFDLSTRVAYDGPCTMTWGPGGGSANNFYYNEDGTKMFFTGTGEAYFLSLTTPYKPSTAVNEGEYHFDLSLNGDPCYWCYDQLDNGLYVITGTGADYYKLGLPTETGLIDEWSTTEVDSKANFTTSAYSGCWSKDGTYFYYHGGFSNIIGRRTASTPFDASTLGAEDHTMAEPASTSTSLGMFIKDDGKTIYIASPVAINYATLGTAWDLTTAGAWSSQAVGAAGGFVMAKHGGAFYVCGAVAGTQTITQYRLTTNWNVTTLTSIATLDISGVISASGTPDSLDLSPDGSHIYALNTAGEIHYWTMSTPYDLSTATYGGTQTFRTLSSPQSMYCDQFNEGDFYCWDGTNNDLYHYTRAGG